MEASAGGGMVTVKVTGDLVVKSIKIDPEAVDPDDVELLQDMVLAAVNEGLRSAQELASTKLGGIAGGLGGRAWATSGSRSRPLAIGTERVRTARTAADHRAVEAARASAVAPLSGWPSICCARATRRRSRWRDAIREVKERIGLCETCFNLADGPRCRICADERRDPEVICVVEEPSDVISIERTHEFRGRYHVLGGALSPIDGIDPEDLKIAELYERVRRRPGARGRDRHQPDDHRRGDRAAHRGRAARARPEIIVTRLASGLPVGADLEYADELTLGRALVGRRAV